MNPIRTSSIGLIYIVDPTASAIYQTGGSTTTSLHPVTGIPLGSPVVIVGVGSSLPGSTPSPINPTSLTTTANTFEVRDPAIPTAQTINVSVTEGINSSGGDYELHSTGEIFPESVETSSVVGNDWVNKEASKDLDLGNATCRVVSGAYSTVLGGKNFDFNLPAGAVIKGIKVRVYRSFING